jgi:hypothetical protein
MTEAQTNTQPTDAAPKKPRMPLRTRILFFVVAWAIVLMPFLFWRSTWFGRPLTDTEITEYLRDDSKPRHIQHALVQIADRMAKARATGHEPADAAQQWYPELVRLANHSVEEIRNTDAWLMGQDPSRPEFHRALFAMLDDGSLGVRNNAALSLVSFGDDAGHKQISAMLAPAEIRSVVAGDVAAVAKPGDSIRGGTMVARLEVQGLGGGGVTKSSFDVRSPISGKLRSVAVKKGDHVMGEALIGVVDPGPEQVWEALRALYLIGNKDDLPLVRQYEGANPDMPDKVREQARNTEKAILEKN